MLAGRQIWASVPKSVPVCVPKDRNGNRIEDDRISPHDPRSPFRAGYPFWDRGDDVTYRVVGGGCLSLADGWGTAEFWMKRWKVDLRDVLDLARRGILDAAFEESTPTKRYRCRDERAALDELSSARLRVRRRL